MMILVVIMMMALMMKITKIMMILIGDKGGVCLRATGAKKRLKSGKQT